MAVKKLVELSNGYRLVDEETVLNVYTRELMSLDEYEKRIKAAESNRLTWVELDAKDVEDILSDPNSFLADVSRPDRDARDILVVDPEGVVSLLRITSLFGGAESYTLAEIDLRYANYLLSNFREEAVLKEFNDFLEEIYELTDVEFTSYEFISENGDTFRNKEVLVDGKLVRYTYKNGYIYSRKEIELKSSADVGFTKAEDTVSRKLATGAFYVR